MTDRLAGFIVTLETPVREDDVESTRKAILQLKGVISVSPVVANAEFYMAREQARVELTHDLLDVLAPK